MLITIARPYATAAFAVARQKNTLAAWDHSLRLAALIIADRRAQSFLKNPKFTYEVHYDYLVQMLALTKATELGKTSHASREQLSLISQEEKNFLKWLAYKKRLLLMPEIAAGFAQLLAAEEQTLHVQVTTALELSEAQQQQLKHALKTKLKKNIVLHCQIDAHLLGGIIVRAGDWVMDGSVSNKLDQLHATLRGC